MLHLQHEVVRSTPVSELLAAHWIAKQPGARHSFTLDFCEAMGARGHAAAFEFSTYSRPRLYEPS